MAVEKRTADLMRASVVRQEWMDKAGSVATGIQAVSAASVGADPGHRLLPTSGHGCALGLGGGEQSGSL